MEPFPYFCVYDFEAILEAENMGQAYGKHVTSSFCILVIRSTDSRIVEHFLYRGEDCVEKFISILNQLSKLIGEWIRSEEVPMTRSRPSVRLVPQLADQESLAQAAVQVWCPTRLGSVVTLLTKHLAPKVQAPPAGLGVHGDATLQTPAFTGGMHVLQWPPLGHLSLLSKMVSCCTISSYFFLCSSNSAFHSSPKLLYLSLNLGSLFPLSSQLSRHAPYLTFPFPGHFHHIRFGPLIQISDLRLELNPLLPLYPYLPLRLLNRIRPFPSYSPKTKFYLLNSDRFILDLASKCERQHLHTPWKRLPLLAALSEWSADHYGSLRSSSTRVCQDKPAGVSSRRVLWENSPYHTSPPPRSRDLPDDVIVIDDVTRISIVIITNDVISDATDDVTNIRIVIVIIAGDVIGVSIVTDDVISDVTDDIIGIVT
ncbi:uncharacterized protein ISCGN_010661 [Ixodes scapularis]